MHSTYHLPAALIKGNCLAADMPEEDALAFPKRQPVSRRSGGRPELSLQYDDRAGNNDRINLLSFLQFARIAHGPFLDYCCCTGVIIFFIDGSCRGKPRLIRLLEQS